MTLECGVCEDDLLPRERMSRCQELMERDKKLLAAILALIVVMNIPYVSYLLYPFLLFSTWVHEMCHGLAGILMGGGISKIYIYSDGSGMAYTSLNGGWYDFKRVVVASAGYTGTALVGGIMLLFRRTRRGPRRITFGVSLLILLSTALWVRNTFGIVAMVLTGIALGLCGWLLEAGPIAYLYSFLAATCCLNAVESIHSMFVSKDCVWGEKAVNDAMTVEEITNIPSWFWGVLWLVFALVMLAAGLLFAVEPSDGAPSAPYAEKSRNLSAVVY